MNIIDRRFAPRKLVAGIGVAGLASAAIAGLGSTSSGAAGNGIASKRPSQILNAALQATGRASSFRMSGAIREKGQNISFQADTSATGDGEGTISLNGQSVDVIVTGQTLYFKASAAFWQQNGAAAQADHLANLWISTSTDNSHFASLAEFVNGPKFIQNNFPKPRDKGTVFTKSGSTIVNGTPAIRLNASNPKNPKDNGAVYVASTGQPYLLRLVVRGGSNSGTMDFSNYNQPVNVQAPPNAIALPTSG